MKEQQIKIIVNAVIRRVLLEAERDPETIQQALDAAYPFGPRHGAVYELWSEEARRALKECGRGAAA